jgi:dolichyldiphosphatase
MATTTNIWGHYPPTSADTLKSFSLTHVQYDPQDPLGKLMAIAALIPLMLIVSYVTVIAVRRDVLATTMLFGQLLNEAINLVAKKTIKEGRPTGTFISLNIRVLT